MRRFVIAAALMLGAACNPALAEPAAPPPPAAAQAVAPSEARLALARRYFAAVRFQSLMDQMSANMLPQMTGEMLKANPNLTDPQRQAIMEVTSDMARSFAATLAEKMIPIMADIFSEEELKAMVGFYESPVGQSILAKQPQMIPRVTQIAVAEMPRMRAETLRRLCAKLDCSKIKLPAGTAS